VANGIEIGRASVVITPVLRGLEKTVERSLSVIGAKAGKSVGDRFAKGVTEGLNTARAAERQYQAELKRTAAAAERAREAEADATRKLRIEETKLNELRSSGKAKTSQLLAAEDRLQKAKNAQSAAIRKVQQAAADEAQALKRSKEALDATASATGKASSAADAAGRRFSGLGAAVGRGLSDAGRTLKSFAATAGKAGLTAGKAFGTALAGAARTAVTAAGRAMQSALRSVANGVKKTLQGIGVAAAAAVVGASAALKSSVTAASAFDKQMRLVSVTLGEGQAGLKKLTDLAIDMGAKTSFSAKGASDAMYELAKGGLSSAEIQAGVLASTLTLATAGGLELGKAASYMVQGMTSFGLSAKDSGKIAAALAGGANASTASVESLGVALSQTAAQAHTAGLSLEDTVTALAALDNAGVKGSDAGTSLKVMLQRLVPQTNTAIQAFEDLGLMELDAATAMKVLRENGIKPVSSDAGTLNLQLRQLAAELSGSEIGSKRANSAYLKLAASTGALSNQFFDAQGNVKSLAEISEVLKETLKGQTREQKIATLNTLFGSDASRAAGIIAETSAKKIGEYSKAVRDQAAAETLAAEATKGFAGAQERLQGGFETLQIQIGRYFLPVLTDAFNFISERMIPQFSDLVDKHAPKLVTAFEKVGTAFKVLWTGEFNVGDSKKLGVGASSPLVDFLYGLRSAAKKTADGIKSALKTVGAGFDLLFTGRVTKDTEKALGGRDSALVQGILGLRAIGERIGEIFGPVMKELGATLKNLFSGADGKKLANSIGSAFSQATQFLGQLLPSIKDLQTALFDALGKIGKKVGPALLSIVKRIVPVLVQLIAKVTPILADLLIELITTLDENLPAIVDLIESLSNTLTSSFVKDHLIPFLGDLLELIIRTAAGIIEIVDGIVNLDLEKIKKGVTQMSGGQMTFFINIVTRLFGEEFDSPEEVGKALGERVFTPLKRETEKALDSLHKSVDDAWNALNKTTGDIWSKISTSVSDALNATKKTAGDTAGAMGSAVASHWRTLQNSAKNIFGTIRATASDRFDKMKTAVGDSASKLKDAATRRFSELRTNVGNAAGQIRDRVAERFSQAKTRAGELARGLKDTVTKRFSEARTNIGNAANTIRQNVSDRFTQARDAAGRAAGTLKDRASKAWTDLRTKTAEMFKRIKEHITNAINALPGAFETAVAAISKAWDALKNKAKDPVRFVVKDVLENGLLAAIRTVANAVGLKDLADKLHVGLPKGFARGGVIPGHSSWRGGDTHLRPMREGEGVYVSEAMRDPYERARLHAVNSAAIHGQSLAPFQQPGYALGGIVDKRVWPGTTRRLSPNYKGHSGIDIPDPQGAPIYAAADGKITHAGYGRGYGQAIFERFVSGLQAVYGHTSKLLVRAGQAVRAGQMIGRVGATGNATGPHIHFEVANGGFAKASNRQFTLDWLRGASNSSANNADTGDTTSWVNPFAKLLDPFNKAKSNALSKLSSIKDSIYGQIVAATPGLVAKGISDKVADLIGRGESEAASPGSFGKGSAKVYGRAGITARNAAAVLAPMFGFSGASTYPGHDPSEARALDFMTKSKSQGDSMSKYAKAHAKSLGINYIIWWRKIWNIQRNAEGWRDYHGTPNPHTDHVHISFFGRGTKYAPKGPAIVGENGPELVMFKGGEQVIPNSALNAMTSGRRNGSSIAAELAMSLRNTANAPVTDVRLADTRARTETAQMGPAIVMNNPTFGSDPREFFLEADRQKRRAVLRNRLNLNAA